MNEILCVQCETYKQKNEFDKRGEHILPRGFGNDGETEAKLIDKICAKCNNDYANAIDTPFLRHVTSREIEKTYAMKRRNKKKDQIITGSGVIVEYNTTTAHLFECIKIAFETHIKFLREEYRDDVFYTLHKLLSDTIDEYSNTSKIKRTDLRYERDLNEIWADTMQPLMAIKYFDVICKNIFRLDRVAENSNEIVTELETRSETGTYASLIQLGYWTLGICVMVCLQSLPPIVVRVSNEIDRYVNDFGRECVHVMDLRSNEKWVGCEVSSDPEFDTYPYN